MQEFPAGSTLIIQEGKYLLVYAKNGFAANVWNNPGGLVENGESFADTAKRETKEEVGLDVSIGKKIGRYFFYDRERDFYLNKTIFEAHITGGDIALQTTEIEKAGWFTREEVYAMRDQCTVGAILSIQHFEAGTFNQEVEVFSVP